MGFGFLRKKEEAISIEEAEARIKMLIEETEENFMSFRHEKISELREEIRSLLKMLQEFEFKDIHPRLRNQARNFVAAMINLWKDLPEMEGTEIISELPERLEKTGFMKIKHFRMLFALNPPVIEQIEVSLKRIAELMAEIETRRKELGLEDLSELTGLMERFRHLTDERDRIEAEVNEITSQISDLEKSERREDSDRVSELIKKLEEEMEEIAGELGKKETEFYRKIAHARKPLRMYAHMVGSKLKLDGDFFLNDLDEISKLASGAVQEIEKGNIKLKKKNLKSVVTSLNEIAEGKLKEEFEEIKKLRKHLRDTENKLKKISMDGKKDDRDELREKLEMMSEMIRKTESEILKTKILLEKKLSEILEKTIRISD